ncbi:MAG: hypothetical protein FWH06_06400 [Oscillospiraceae bacterium]|nr:hypothetical protein [Oscillospiraceae bacterium]
MLSVILAAALALSPAPKDMSLAAEASARAYAQVTVTESSNELAGLTQKNVVFDGGEFAWFRRFSFKTTRAADYITAISIPGGSGTVRWYDAGAELWRVRPLDGALPDSLLFIETDRYYMILSQPYSYKPFENASLEDMPRRRITASAKEDGRIELTMRFAQTAGLIGDVWALQSDSPLIEWTDAAERLWASYVRVDTQRWCYDGFYSASPSTYTPTSEAMFFRNPAAWLTNAFVRTGGSRASEALGWAMCDTLIELQNQQGFWPTEPRSEWLYDDYGIGAGFYDTRFNNDFTYALFDAARRYGDARFSDAALRQADFLIWLAGRRNYEFRGAGGAVGWLVEDYYWPDGDYGRVHSSLNHQLQEIKTLLRAYQATRRRRYLDFADRLLRGVKLTRDRWIMESGSLEYAYMPDGSMGLIDYPFMTYNDLYDVQELLTAIGRPRDPDLQILMDSKKTWMDKNGVTGYYK